MHTDDKEMCLVYGQKGKLGTYFAVNSSILSHVLGILLLNEVEGTRYLDILNPKYLRHVCSIH